MEVLGSSDRETASAQGAAAGRVRATLVPILLLAFLLRVQGLAAQGFWYDEGSSVALAGQSLPQILLGKFDHPPLYHLLLGVWIRLAGNSEFGARYLSVALGLLVVALGGALASALLGRRAGAIAALLLAVSPIEVWYAQEARMYALLGALTLASSICLVRLMGGEGRPRLWLYYTLANVAAIYTHYYGALILLAQAAWVLLHLAGRRDWRLARAWVLAQVGLALALVPWLPVVWMYWRAANATYWPGQLSWQYVVAQTGLGFAGAGLTVSDRIALPLIVATAGLAVLGLLYGALRREARLGTALLAILIVVPLAAFCGFVHDRPKFSPRYLLVVVPALLGLAAAGVAALWPARVRRWHQALRLGLAMLVAGGLAAGSAYAATNGARDPALGRDDLHGAAAFLTQAVAPDEAVILLSGHLLPAFTYYYQRDNCYPIPPKLTPVPSVDDVLTLDVLDDLDRALAGRQGAWLVLWQDDVIDPNGVVLAAFDRLATREPVDRQFRGLELRHYTLPPGSRLQRDRFQQTPVGATVGQGELTLVSCDLPAAVRSGGTADILLHWQAARETPLDYRAELQVLDELGQVRASGGGRLAGWMYPTSRWPAGRLISGCHDVRLPPGLPPGRYTLRVRVFAVGSDAVQLVPLGELDVRRAGRPPALGELGIAHPLMASFGEMQVLGYDLSPAEAAPGQTVSLALYLRALERPAQAYRVAVTLGGRPWASLPLPASAAEMEPGDIFRVQYPLPLPRDAAAGEQPVAIALEGEAGAAVAPVALTILTVSGGERSFAVPETIQHPARFSLGEAITFLGHDLDRDSLRPGESFHLTLYWQAVQPMDTSYTVFVHLLDGQEKVWGQVDAIPGAGGRPTTGWLPGEVLADSYDVTAKADAPQGSYMIEIGLYNPANGERLSVRDADGQIMHGDRILLSPVQLLPPS